MENGEKNQTKVNIALIISIVALLGIAVLFVLSFTDKSKDTTTKENKTEIPAIASTTSGSIAFVDTDKILEEYELVNMLSEQLDKERRKKDSDFSQRQKEYEEEAAYFQESVQNQSLSEQSAQRIYEQLMMKQQELIDIQEAFAAELAKQEFDINMLLLDSIRNYLDRINIDNRFDYVLNYNLSGSVLLAKDTLDITTPVINGLNAEYNAKYISE